MNKPKKPSDTDIEKLFGVSYHPKGTNTVVKSSPGDRYTYTCHIGNHEIPVEEGDSVWYLEQQSGGKLRACVTNGPTPVQSPLWGTVIRGYKAWGDKTVTLSENTVLPYVNGCSTAQVFPPDRGGDPTLQMLRIPPYSSEQAHHIHSTVRLVYVLAGQGYSIVGQQETFVKKELLPGMVVVLQKMAPHHFETEDKWLTVIPLHVWSALPGGLENDHPMFNGTFMVNQGK